MSHVTLIAGARPNFMKIAPLSRAFQGAGLSVRLVHTGQHYDEKMSGTFFKELGIPEPDVNLGVGSGSHIAQISEVMRRLEREFTDHRPHAVVVVGDVNSTLAAALTANKLGVAVAHVEAGLRSFDRGMPEEINRIMTDAISDWLFTSEPAGKENLRREGIAPERIYESGNVMIDTLHANLADARSLNAPARFEVTQSTYAILTLHRPSNVDDPQHLRSIMEAIDRLAQRMPVLFPVHPRTAGKLRELGYGTSERRGDLRLVEPLSYLLMLGLVDSARLVLTDSGGLQEESTALRIPCLTLRENTERPITVAVGSNRLVGWQTDAIDSAIAETLAKPNRIGEVPANWDGRAATRIASTLGELLQ